MARTSAVGARRKDAANRELIDDRVGELTLERERLEQKLESLTHLLLSKEESEEIIVETARFVAALKSSLTDGPLDQRQAAIRRCVEQIVVNRKEGQCKTTFRKIPIIVDGSLVVATQDVETQLQCAEPKPKYPRSQTCAIRATA